MSASVKAAPAVKSYYFATISMVLLAVFALFSIPELFDPLLTFHGMQLRYFFVSLFLVIVAVASVTRISIGSRIYLCVVILQTLLMTGVGIAQRDSVIFQWRILGYDVFVLGGYICGMFLVLDQPAWRVLKFIRLAYLLWLGGLLLDSSLLALGLIPPVWFGDPRVHVWAEYICIEGLLLAMPFCLHPVLQQGPRLLRGRFLSIVGLATILAVNIAMGARSIVVQIIAAVVLCVPLYAPRTSRILLYSTVFALSLGIGILVLTSTALSDVYAVQRLQQTDVSNEERLEELHSLFNYIGWHAVFGLGNGSGFPSPTEREEDDFAAYPHLGIFAPFQKGGIPATVVLIIAPLAMVLTVLFRAEASALQQEAATSALLCMLYSCVSGGWLFPYWIFFGLAAGYCFYGRSGRALELDAKVARVSG